MTETDRQMVDTYIAQIEAHLKEVRDAEKELKAEAKRLKRSARNGETLNFDTIHARVYAFGSAARWFLHPLAPQRNSPSLEGDRSGRKGKHPSDGII